MAGNDRTQTNGIIKNENVACNFLDAGNDRTQTNGIIKDERGAVKFFSGWKLQYSNQWDSKK